MSILYRCDNCSDTSEGYYSESRSQWEPPEGWLCCDRIHRVEDEERSRYRHFCSGACLLAFVETQVEGV